MLRIGMTNPPYILEHLKEIADVLRHPCVYSFLHVPVQSGSDAVLSVSLRMCKCFPSNSYWFFFDVPYNPSYGVCQKTSAYGLFNLIIYCFIGNES